MRTSPSRGNLVCGGARRSSAHQSARRAAFSLVELVIVIVIIGIIAAIAVPRFSAATENAATKADEASEAILQNAVDLWVAEHPGVALTAAMLDPSHDGGTGTDCSGNNSILTVKSDGAGICKLAGAFGPYLREVPDRQTGANKNSQICATGSTTGCGWEFDNSDNSIKQVP